MGFEIRSTSPIPSTAYAAVANAVEMLELLVNALRVAPSITVDDEGDD